ncbi:MAG TPA: MBL fold metallo-hydrolase [Solirubrobacteraceae bacterium]|nr:MBL fold metallo-hydrolase [Solirubrobacteraceae bacterium]
MKVYFRQILHPDLGCASYFIADQGEAAVVDPKWEIDEYLAAAADAGAEIRHVLETHNHADHVSGRRRLAAATGAAIHAPDGSGDNGREQRGVVRLGRVELVEVASPGHRPEHVAYLVREQGTDRALLSGDSLLVGDVARPDLAVDAAEGAEALWHTLRRLAALEDEVELWPGHVGGSLCASRAASSATSSTIGQERRVNLLLTLGDPAAFAAELTCSVPARPPNVERVVALNVEGAADPGPVPELDPRALGTILDDGVCVLDLRDPEDFDAGHLDGSVNLPGDGRGLGTRAGWAAGAGEPIVLVAPSLEAGCRSVELLRAAGVWNLAGVSVADPSAWREAELVVRTVDALSPDRVLPRIEDGSVELLDVRDLAEWNEGHLAASQSLPLSQLGDGRVRAAAVEAPVAVVCASGVRAALAASILRRRGCDPVWRVSGGVEELARLGAPMIGGAEARRGE